MGAISQKGSLSKSCCNVCCPYLKIMTKSVDNFTHAMTAQLSWHVQNCNLTWSLETISKQGHFSQDFNNQLIKPLRNGSQGSLLQRLQGLHRDHSVYAPGQWERAFQCNTVSHRVGAYAKWSLPPIHVYKHMYSVDNMAWLYKHPSKCHLFTKNHYHDLYYTNINPNFISSQNTITVTSIIQTSI